MRSPAANSRSPALRRSAPSLPLRSMSARPRLLRIATSRALERDHHVRGWVELGVFPPVGEQSRSRGDRRSAQRRVARASLPSRRSRVRAPRRIAASAARSSGSCWRRFWWSSTAPTRSMIARKSPPAPTDGSCSGSPTRIDLGVGSLGVRRSGASVRVSAMPASSTITTARSRKAAVALGDGEQAVEGDGRGARSHRRASRAAAPDGAAPSTGTPASVSDANEARSRGGLPGAGDADDAHDSLGLPSPPRST